LQALTLIDILPEQRDAVLARADDYANNRLVCGVHYPTDLAASKVLAYTIHALMTANPRYHKKVPPPASKCAAPSACRWPATKTPMGSRLTFVHFAREMYECQT